MQRKLFNTTAQSLTILQRNLRPLLELLLRIFTEIAFFTKRRIIVYSLKFIYTKFDKKIFLTQNFFVAEF